MALLVLLNICSNRFDRLVVIFYDDVSRPLGTERRGAQSLREARKLKESDYAAPGCAQGHDKIE
jgi:hypothetical protein